MNSTIKYYYYRFRELVLKKLCMQRIIQTNFGIKFLNGSSFRTQCPINIKGHLELESKDIYLGMDYLKDDYTLVNVNIKDTPHYEFMSLLDNNEDISHSNYIKRFYNGTLDARIPHKKYNNYSSFYRKHRFVKSEIIKGTYSPVVVYKIKEKYYIYDGKHRAALCAYLSVPIKCAIIDPYSVLCQNSKTVMSIMYHNACYSRNCTFFDDAIK